MRIRYIRHLFVITAGLLSPSMFLGQNARTQAVRFGIADCGSPDSKPVELPSAKVGVPYAFALETNLAAHFERVEGNADWLRVTDDGVIMGTPPAGALKESEITVCAHFDHVAGNRDRLVRTFIVPLQPDRCSGSDFDALSWCDSEAIRPSKGQRFAFAPEEGNLVPSDPDCDGASGCILQFDRLSWTRGRFGHFDRAAHHSSWFERLSPGLPEDSIINAINASKVFISGSVLIRKHVNDCPFWSWQVMAQTEDSSNNLFYGPSDVSSFCTAEENGTVLIVLPVHVIWASVFGTPANTNDPSWKPVSEPPKGHECWSGKKVTSGTPTQGIRPCDTESQVPSKSSFSSSADSGDHDYSDEKSAWLLRDVWYSPPIRFGYNHLAQPGVSQGSISIAPIDAATKATFDVQVYGSTLWGPGWFGLQGMYEHDRNAADDLNSLTAAISYDFRLWNSRKGPGSGNAGLQDPPAAQTFASRWWAEWPAHKGSSANCFSNDGHPVEGNCSPPIVGIRPAELAFRAGPEWSPDGLTYTKTKQYPTQYLPRDLNFVMGSTVRFPIVLSPSPRQPSQFAIAPVLGLEGGFRVISHEIGTATTCTGMPISTTCPAQPPDIFRQVYGVDASARWPYNITHNFLGDRPLTVDFSYRVRRLSYAEPFGNEMNVIHHVGAPDEGQSLGDRSYTRITFIAPYSAYLQIRATWQHGALPPTFQFVGNQVTFGLTFSNPGLSEH